MRLQYLAVVGSLLGVASAHFRLQYPLPRGPFVAANEPNFCGGYTNVTTNRTEFPLDGGFIAITGSHPHFTFGVIISTDVNPDNFTEFTQAVDFFTHDGAGTFCLPVNFGRGNGTSLSDGTNVTVQVVYDAGDGKLYQCADLTLKQSATMPSNVSCTNGTQPSTSSSATLPTTSTSEGVTLLPSVIAGLLSIAGFVLAAL